MLDLTRHGYEAAAAQLASWARVARMRGRAADADTLDVGACACRAEAEHAPAKVGRGLSAGGPVSDEPPAAAPEGGPACALCGAPGLPEPGGLWRCSGARCARRGLKVPLEWFAADAPDGGAGAVEPENGGSPSGGLS